MQDAYIENARREIRRWEAWGPGFLANLGESVLGRFQRPFSVLIPAGVQEAAGRAIEKSLSGLGVATGLTVSQPRIHRRVHVLFQRTGHRLEAADLAAKHYRSWHLGAALGEGGAIGAGGGAGLAADIPALLAISLRLVQHIVVCYGYDISRLEEREFVKHVLWTGSAADLKAKTEALSHLKILEGILLKASRDNLAPDLARKEISQRADMPAVRQIARVLGIQITKRKALQIVPVLGAVVGASFNASFVHDAGEAAYMSYRRRWIADAEGPDV